MLWDDEKRAKKGNLINAKCALAAPPHYLPLVEPLRPGSLLLLLLLLCVSPAPSTLHALFLLTLLPAARHFLRPGLFKCAMKAAPPATVSR